MNALARRDVSIVSAIPGTTRDLVEASLDLRGFPVTLVDTAGLRESDDPIEREGVARARRRAERADLTLWLTDSTAPSAPASTAAGPAIAVATKADLGGRGGGGARCAISAADRRRESNNCLTRSPMSRQSR